MCDKLNVVRNTDKRILCLFAFLLAFTAKGFCQNESGKIQLISEFLNRHFKNNFEIDSIVFFQLEDNINCFEVSCDTLKARINEGSYIAFYHIGDLIFEIPFQYCCDKLQVEKASFLKYHYLNFLKNKNLYLNKRQIIEQVENRMGLKKVRFYTNSLTGVLNDKDLKLRNVEFDIELQVCEKSTYFKSVDYFFNYGYLDVDEISEFLNLDYETRILLKYYHSNGPLNPFFTREIFFDIYTGKVINDTKISDFGGIYEDR